MKRNPSKQDAVWEQQSLLFVSELAHDVRSFFIPVAGLMTLFQESYSQQLSSEAQAAIKDLILHCSLSLQFIDDLITASTTPRLKGLVPHCNPSACIAEVLQLLRLPHTVTIETSISVPTLPVERADFNRVLLNLISNSVKHAHARELSIVISCKQVLHEYWLSVRDNGQGGISEESIQQTDLRAPPKDPRVPHRSFGLGLTIVKKIVARWGGLLKARSGPSLGTEFIIVFPQVLEEKPQE